MRVALFGSYGRWVFSHKGLDVLLFIDNIFPLRKQVRKYRALGRMPSRLVTAKPGI